VLFITAVGAFYKEAGNKCRSMKRHENHVCRGDGFSFPLKRDADQTHTFQNQMYSSFVYCEIVTTSSVGDEIDIRFHKKSCNISCVTLLKNVHAPVCFPENLMYRINFMICDTNAP